MLASMTYWAPAGGRDCPGTELKPCRAVFDRPPVTAMIFRGMDKRATHSSPLQPRIVNIDLGRNHLGAVRPPVLAAAMYIIIAKIYNRE